jgi:PEP-CTERM motif
MIKKLATMSVLISLIAMVTAVQAAIFTLPWKDARWAPYYGSVAASGANMAVTATTPYYFDENLNSEIYRGQTKCTTPSDFQASPCQYVRAKFIDPYIQGTAEPTISLEVDDWIQYPYNFAQISADGEQYSISLENYTNNQSDQVFFGTRTAGEHEFAIGKNSDDTVGFYLDGSLIYTDSTIFLPQSLNQAGLAYINAGVSSGGTGIFTDYSISTFIPDSIPEPATISLLTIGAITLLRKRK